MFDSDEEKLIYLAGCALTGAATTPADVGKITRQAYGIAEEMLALINKLKQTSEYAPENSIVTQSLYGKTTIGPGKRGDTLAGQNGDNQPTTGPIKTASEKPESKTLVVAKAANDDKAAKDDKKAKEGSSAKEAGAVVAHEKGDVLNAKTTSEPEDAAVVEHLKIEELSKTGDKGWNYTPWGK